MRLKARRSHSDAEWEGLMELIGSIKRRIEALRLSLGEARDERTAMAATLFIMFASGTVLGALGIPLSSYLSGTERLGEAAACATGLGACVLILFYWRRLPLWSFQVLLAVGTIVVSVGTLVASVRPTTTEMFYIWVALYAAYFFTRRQAVAQIAFVGIAYAGVLALGHSAGNEIARWVITMGTIIVAAILFGRIKELLDSRLAERERSERELEESLSLQRATLESTADGILVVDRDGKIVSFNQRFKEMWRLPDDVVESETDDRAIAFVCDQLTEPTTFVRKINQLYKRPEAESFDMLQFKDDRVFERYSRPQMGTDGEIHGRVWSFRDVTERERIQSRLRHLADHDPLTGLLNRRRFEEELSERVAHGARYETGGAVLLLDLDNFKYVNDSLGHRTGDAVIRSVADLLRSQMRETDVLGRLGGDEFAILLPYADLDQATVVAGKLLESLRRHRAVFRGKRLRLTTSIGVSAISDARVQTAEEVMVEADVAVYEAKEAGRDRFSVYAPTTDGKAETGGSPAWADRIRRALDNERFTLYAQPILSLQTNEISQYELLVRMQNGDGELLPPHAFLPSAERSGMVREIDMWVTRQAIRLIAHQRRAGEDLRLEVNLSGRTLGDPTLPRTIQAEIANASIDPGNLIFEVTETTAVLNMDEARDFAVRLTEMGCRFALDDFGAGFGSFYYLKYLPLEFLKIDGDFIGDLASNVTDQAMVRAIVDLSAQLRKATIAEFVGDDRTLELLRAYGVDYAQGYHVGRPVPVSELWADATTGVATTRSLPR
jgi:diguanylate cyclase (GGDEF)-like protein/PAS domain S-box-containing protein